MIQVSTQLTQIHPKITVEPESIPALRFHPEISTLVFRRYKDYRNIPV